MGLGPRGSDAHHMAARIHDLLRPRRLPLAAQGGRRRPGAALGPSIPEHAPVLPDGGWTHRARRRELPRHRYRILPGHGCDLLLGARAVCASRSRRCRRCAVAQLPGGTRCPALVLRGRRSDVRPVPGGMCPPARGGPAGRGTIAVGGTAPVRPRAREQGDRGRRGARPDHPRLEARHSGGSTSGRALCRAGRGGGCSCSGTVERRDRAGVRCGAAGRAAKPARLSCGERVRGSRRAQRLGHRLGATGLGAGRRLGTAGGMARALDPAPLGRCLARGAVVPGTAGPRAAAGAAVLLQLMCCARCLAFTPRRFCWRSEAGVRRTCVRSQSDAC